MERTQELLYHLHELFEQKQIPDVPVFMDSPLAIKITALYKKYEDYFNKESYNLVRSGDDIFNFPELRLTLTTEQSKEINHVRPPKVIIAGSGMSQGGRIMHHEQRYLSDPKSAILFVGYQARNSLGRRIMEGAQTVHIFGEEIPVHCQRRTIRAYSAHADQPRLLSWLSHMAPSLKKIFTVHGEPEQASALIEKIHDQFHIPAVAPQAGDRYEL